MKLMTAGVAVVVLVAIAAGAEKSHHSSSVDRDTGPAFTVHTGHIAISRHDASMDFTATCDDQGGVVTLHPDTSVTRPAAASECRDTAREYAALSSVAASGG